MIYIIEVTGLVRTPLPVKVLAYVDNAIAFLKDAAELQSLLQSVFLYGRGSNVRINHYKILAVLLSDKGQLGWHSMISGNRILQWHDNKESTATIYLGYPLTSTTQ